MEAIDIALEKHTKSVNSSPVDRQAASKTALESGCQKWLERHKSIKVEEIATVSELRATRDTTAYTVLNSFW